VAWPLPTGFAGAAFKLLPLLAEWWCEHLRSFEAALARALASEAAGTRQA
jgi:hypothetical protein